MRTGAGGAVWSRPQKGVEALRCTGLPETLVYDGVPEGLSARPTLSVRARSGRAGDRDGHALLSRHGFDWQANYVATCRATAAMSTCSPG